MYYKIGSSIFLQINKNLLLNTKLIKSIQLKKNFIQYEFVNQKINGFISGNIILSSGDVFGSLTSNFETHKEYYKTEKDAENVFNTLFQYNDNLSSKIYNSKTSKEII